MLEKDIKVISTMITDGKKIIMSSDLLKFKKDTSDDNLYFQDFG